LIHIRSWDFNWQEEYFYAEPIALPAGTVVHAHYVYDNSADNPFNPNDPPQRVRHGFQSSDEMAELQLQVLTSEWERPLLWHDFVQLSYTVDQANVERGLEQHPESGPLRDDAFKYCLRRKDAAGALAHAQKMLDLASESAEALTRLGQAQLLAGDAAAAIATLVRAVELEPKSGKALYQLGRAHQRAGHAREAAELFGKVLARDPRNFLAHGALGELLLGEGKSDEAARHCEAALATNPEHLLALWSLARIELGRGQTERARERCMKVLEIAADEGGAHFVLGLMAEQAGRGEDARRRYELAVRFEPDVAEFRAALARVNAGQER
jgi:tetratricopeptide (TPR) repeat protein